VVDDRVTDKQHCCPEQPAVASDTIDDLTHPLRTPRPERKNCAPASTKREEKRT
jgi:hypothetical protein